MSMPIERIIKIEPDISDETLADFGFYWREKNGVKVLICRPLEDAGFANGFSTRLGGVSPFPSGDLNLAGFDEDSAENINENRCRFLDVFEGHHTLTTAWQVHGDQVKIIKTRSDAAKTEERYDALASDLPGIFVGVKTADCVPVLLSDPVNKAFSAVHAGWRGTAASIAAKAVKKMSEVYGSDPSAIICSMGPAAGCDKYEIGQDVIEAFDSNISDSKKYFVETRPGHALIDLKSANKDQLTACGLKPSNIYTAPFCTLERTDLFFSYRIEKKLYGKTGRLLSVIGTS